MFSSLSIFSSISDIFRLFSFPLSNRFPYVYGVSSQIRFNFTPCQDYCLEHTFQIDALNCSALPVFTVLWLLLTSHSSLLLRLMRPSVRPHGISSDTFSVYSPDLHIKIYGCLSDFSVCGHLILLIRLNIRFLFVKPRFRYCFFSPISHDINLASRYRVRRQLRPLGLSPKPRNMPVIPQ